MHGRREVVGSGRRHPAASGGIGAERYGTLFICDCMPRSWGRGGNARFATGDELRDLFAGIAEDPLHPYGLFVGLTSEET